MQTTTNQQLTDFIVAGDLHSQGYRRVSNKYKLVARIDRDDWLDVLAKEMRCSRADFYNFDGSGISDSWKDHYVRVYSKDQITVSPEIYKLMKGW
jgi:translation initiation factor IF-1